jgi:uncharacterized membrane protein HdeD (DUF308 family)
MDFKKVNWLLFILGLILILDGIISYIAQYDEVLMYHLPRATRGIIGIYICYISFYPLDKVKLEYKIHLTLIGIILIIDGIISILDQIDETMIFQIGRYIRIGIGVIITIYPLKKKEIIIILPK